jgi:hypothetical protein
MFVGGNGTTYDTSRFSMTRDVIELIAHVIRILNHVLSGFLSNSQNINQSSTGFMRVWLKQQTKSMPTWQSILWS